MKEPAHITAVDYMQIIRQPINFLHFDHKFSEIFLGARVSRQTLQDPVSQRYTTLSFWLQLPAGIETKTHSAHMPSAEPQN